MTKLLTSKGIVLTMLSIVLFGCTQKEPSVFTEAVLAIDETEFQKTLDNKEVNLYTLVGENGMGMKVTNYGARIVALCVPDKNGNQVDVVLGYDNLDDYKSLREAYLGAAIGRYGNRIAKGKFSLGDQEFQLPQNNGENALHGGPSGYHDKVWDVSNVSDSKIVFTMESPDGDQGYPGNLSISMSYEISAENELIIDYSASTDQVTICNLTNHSYFNLSGDGAATINDHVLTINSDLITPVDESLIPTGELMPVEGTAFDFNEPTVIGDRIEEDHIQLKYGNGYDHNWIVNKTQEGIELVASVYSPITNIQMDVLSDQPGLQFYGGNFLTGKEIGKAGKAYPFRSALCLETQHYPDSPNQAHFPTTTLLPGDIYKHVCIYKFSVKQ
ncbi:MAG: galactose mutarotase [Prolixibacteraceae bacterium]|jgi:aldose 1-epimerase|nr:galactose mutarotase [Prolixibacteraceae bacterium]